MFHDDLQQEIEELLEEAAREKDREKLGDLMVRLWDLLAKRERLEKNSPPAN